MSKPVEPEDLIELAARVVAGGPAPTLLPAEKGA
jgi:hypothetical protein